MTATVTRKWNGTDVKLKGKRVVNKSAYEIGLVIEGQAKALCAVKTGRLAGSITTQAPDKGTAPGAPATGRDVIAPPLGPFEVFVGTAVEYAPYVEFGTSRSSAQPFLWPSLDLARGKAMTIVDHNGRFEFREYLKE